MAQRPARYRTGIGVAIIVAVLAAAGLLLWWGLAGPESGRSTSGQASGGWVTVFSDTFGGSRGSGLDHRWTYDIGTHYHGDGCPARWGTREVDTATRAAANVSADGNGHLLITPLRSRGHWTSGRIETARSDFAAPPGGELKILAAIRQPAPRNGLGYWPAFWLLGSGFRASGAGTSGTMACRNWPAGGEIDILEDVNARSEYSGTLHCGTAEGGPCHESTGFTSGLRPCPGCQSGYHTYGLVINRRHPGRESMSWLLDGKAYKEVDETDVGTRPWQAAVDHGFFLILNVAIGGAYPDRMCGCTTPTAATSSGAPMGVRSVTVYTRAG